MANEKPDQISVFDTFKMLRSQPLIQFLTWHLLLVEEWKFEDLADFTVAPSQVEVWGKMQPAWHCRFLWRSGRTASFNVRQKSSGDFIMDTIWGMG